MGIGTINKGSRCRVSASGFEFRLGCVQDLALRPLQVCFGRGCLAQRKSHQNVGTDHCRGGAGNALAASNATTGRWVGLEYPETLRFICKRLPRM